MNVGALLMLFLVACAAVICVALIGSKYTAPYVDTQGNTTNNVTNSSQAIAGNLTATGSQVGGGVIFLIAGIFCIFIIGALAALALGKL
jgi:hypothetical protein